jgi:hypothetical protein
MDMAAVEHVSGKRLHELAISAETFVEERMLYCLLHSILTGGRIEIFQGGQSEAEYSDLYDEEASVFCFRRQEEVKSDESSDSS